MGACFSSSPERTALLLRLDDGSTLRLPLSALPLLPTEPPPYLAGPLCRFGLSQPCGTKPLSPADLKMVGKALRKDELYHGGEQCLFAAWGALAGKPAVLVLTSLGRLFAVGGGKVLDSVHVVQLASARLSGEGELLLRLQQGGGGGWQVSTSPAAAAALQQMVWVAHSLAEGELRLGHNMARLPMHLLPPAAEADGNLHAAYTMHANALGLAEPEEVLRNADGAGEVVTTALQCVRRWAAVAEVDASEWKPAALGALARALARNDRFIGFRLADAPFGAALAELAPMLASNRRLVALELTGVGGEPAALGALGDALATNAHCLLSVLDLSRNELGDAGALRLAAGLAALRPGLLAELRLERCAMGEDGVVALLGALRRQRNLLQLRLGDNAVGVRRGSDALAELLPDVPKLEELGLGHTHVDPDVALGPLSDSDGRAAPLGALGVLELDGLPWSGAVLNALGRCGMALRRLSLAGGAQRTEPATRGSFLAALTAAAGTRPELELDLSTDVGPVALASELAAALEAAGSGHVPSLRLSTGGRLGDVALASLLAAYVRAAAAAAAAGRPAARLLDLSLAVPPPASVISAAGLTDEYALAMFDQLAGAVESGGGAGIVGALARWGLTLPPGTEEAAARRVAAVRALVELVRGEGAPAALRLAGGFTSRAAAAQAPAFGPQLGDLFRFGLTHPACALTELDVAGNRLGDEALGALGSALKANRTLTALSLDNNGATVDGLKPISLALKGNKKVVTLPLPDDDLAAALEAQANAYKASLVRELNARATVKSAYMRGGYVNHRRKEEGLAALKAAKQEQARARVAKDKLRTVAATLGALVARNQEVATLKRAGKDARAESKLAERASKAAAKAKARAAALREKQKAKVWLARHRLLDAWTAHAKALARQGHDGRWYTAWHAKWGKPYLNPAGLASVLRAMPLEQKEQWASLVDQAEDAFAAEEGLDAQVQALLNEERQHRAQAEFHSAEVQYYGMLAKRDPAAVAQKPAEPGILPNRPPGKERPGQFGHGPYTNWAARYRWITGELQGAIRSEPPADYKWRAVAAEARAREVAAEAAPMVTYPPAKPVEATASVAMGVPVVEGAAATTYGADGAPLGLPYPAKPPKDSVYAAPVASAPEAGGKPEPPRPKFEPQLATPLAPAGERTVAVIVPQGVMPGQMMQLRLPDGGMVQCQVPAGAQPGAQIQLRVPTPSTPTSAPAAAPPPTEAALEPYRPPQHKQYTYSTRNGQYYADDDYMQSGFDGLGAYHSYNTYRRDRTVMRGRPYQYRHYSHTYYHYDPFFFGLPYYGLGYHYGWGYGYGYGYGYYGYGHGYGHGYGDGYNEGYQDGAEDQEAADADEGADGADADVLDPVGDAYGEDTPLDLEAADPADLGEAEGAELDEGAEDAEAEMGDEADAVDMYAGAGPRDLPDGRRRRGGGGTAAPSLTVAESRRYAELARLSAGDHVSSVLSRLESEWARAIARAEDEVLGPLRPLTYASTRWALPASPPTAPVTLVTQCSLDRLPRLRMAAEAWSGPVSAAVYVPAPKGSVQAAAAEEMLRDELDALGPRAAAQLTIVLLYMPAPAGQHAGAPAPPLPGSAAEYDALYPINALRNLALDGAPTDLVLLLDVDFVPSAGLLRDLMHSGALGAVASSITALVLPAFEVTPSTPLPRSQAALASLVHAGLASAFHVAHFPRGHAPTNTARWLAAAAPYHVPYEEYYEPYIVASRSWLPRYDERFRGYGMNKVSHLYAVAAAGATFVVQPAHFVVAHEHAKSGAWEMSAGPAANPAHRMRIAALYRRFKAECPPLPAAQIERSRAEATAPAVVTQGKLSTATKRAAHQDVHPAGHVKRACQRWPLGAFANGARRAVRAKARRDMRGVPAGVRAPRV